MHLLIIKMNWKPLTTIEELEEINLLSANKGVVIFKHSTRCSISAGALNRVERNYTEASEEKFAWYYLDLIRHRDVSNAIAEKYHVAHESPQVLVIHNGVCTYTASHFDIRYEEILQH